jgi:hypothetical protein
MGIKSLLKQAIRAAGYEVQRREDYHETWVPPGHFYSPLVDTNELRRDAARVFERNREIPDIDLNEHGQLQLIGELRHFYRDLPFQDTQSEANLYYYDNPYYSYGDAILLACMLRHVRPKRLIEFGCGFSSCVILDINRLFLGRKLECTFIDPNPERLKRLSKRYDGRINIVESRAQDIDLQIVTGLERNDIIFIDSTHVTKAGSDVNFHLFDVLPRLAPGVLIHFHDVFYPFEYPESWFFEENRSWNENYILRAFLAGNSNYEIVLFNDFMKLRHLREITKDMPLFGKNSGGALWIRKLR